MSRKGSSARGNANPSPIANGNVVGPSNSGSVSSTLSLLHALEAQRQYETAKQIQSHSVTSDRRRHNPTRKLAAPHSIYRSAAQIGHFRHSINPLNAVQFRVPNAVTICLRRKVRREVYFALNLKGKSGGKRRRNFWSSVKC